MTTAPPAALRAALPAIASRRPESAAGTRFSNGDLLNAAETAGFEVLLTTDKNMQYQQNLAGRQIAIVVLGNSQWPVVRFHLDIIAGAVNAATPGSCAEVDIPFR